MSCKVVYIEALFNLGYQNTLNKVEDIGEIPLSENKNYTLVSHNQRNQSQSFAVKIFPCQNLILFHGPTPHLAHDSITVSVTRN